MTRRKAYSLKNLVPRIPLPCGDLQVNFCRNPECANYGKPASADYHKPFEGGCGRYHRGGGNRHVAGLICKECDKASPLKNNEEIAAELKRLSAYLYPKEPSCPDENCVNHDVPVSVGRTAYRRYGFTRAKSARYECKRCGEMFTVRLNALRWQHKPEKNKEIFKKLVNHAALKRIVEEAEIGSATLYGKVDYFFEQCRAFAGELERRLPDRARLGFHRLYLSTDVQEHVMNWKYHEEKMNVKLSAVCTADNDSGFVFGAHLNYDPVPTLDDLEAEAAPDKLKPEAFRKHCRYWLREDYLVALERSRKKGKKRARVSRKQPTSPMEQIRAAARAAGRRYNVESTELMHSNLQLPLEGVQVKKDYTTYAHFLFLRDLFADNFAKLRFFTDYDSGLRSACVTAFQPEIVARRVDAAYVTVTYGLPKPAKLQILNTAKKAFKAAAAEHPELTESQLKTKLMMEQIDAKQSDMYWRDLWVKHPLPDMNEPQKMVSLQTNLGGFTTEHLANLMRKASLHGVNRFFNVVKRRLQTLDSPKPSASTQRREYNAYGLYNPVHAGKLLEILRVYYNYVLGVAEHHGEYIPKAQRQTPAQYLGLVDRPYTIEEILKFVPAALRKEAERIPA